MKQTNKQTQTRHISRKFLSSTKIEDKFCYFSKKPGRDSSVGIATRYGLDGPGIESRWGTKFSASVQTGPGAHPASCIMGTGSFLGVKWPERGVDYQPPYSVEVKGTVEL